VSLDAATATRRMAVMGAINVVAVVAALAAIVGYFKFGVSWALIVFVAALVAGFGAQIWFIAGLRRVDKGV